MSEFLRQKFAGDQAAVRTLEQIAETPSAEGAQSDLRLAIDRHLESDPKFREELLAALASEGYERDDVLNARITVSDRANVGKIVQIKSVQGDVSF
ncbi:hypothetical protein ACIQZN_25010 [Streptomyces sp. NPDC097595]|uniref:hypothetical protein n=1 Tax=Streptomyces sp. NPDC097595 TaxID=3366090 RepID=UPI003801A4A6